MKHLPDPNNNQFPNEDPLDEVLVRSVPVPFDVQDMVVNDDSGTPFDSSETENPDIIGDVI